MTIREEIKNNLKEAMIKKNVDLISALRLVVASIKDRDIIAKGKGNDLGINDEEIMIEMFANNIIIAGQEFLNKPNHNPLTPNWNRVQNTLPDFKDKFIQAVDEDSKI